MRRKRAPVRVNSRWWASTPCWGALIRAGARKILPVRVKTRPVRVQGSAVRYENVTVRRRIASGGAGGVRRGCFPAARHENWSRTVNIPPRRAYLFRRNVDFLSLPMRFSRTQLVGALALLALVWLVILFRLFFPSL